MRNKISVEEIVDIYYKRFEKYVEKNDIISFIKE